MAGSKKTPGNGDAIDTPTAEEETRLDALLGTGEYTGKPDVARARGKEPATPNAGRLAAGKTKADPTIRIPRQNLATFEVTVVGLESMIPHAWGRKALATMLGDHMQLDQEAGMVKKKEQHAEKDPFMDFVDALYANRQGFFGYPANAFKGAMVESVRHVSGVTMKDLLECVHVLGELVPIYGWPRNRLDPVTIGTFNNRVADLRFRGEFIDWAAVLQIRHDTDVISMEQVLHLVQRAGSVGVGEWRPSKSGNHGLFEVFPGTPDEKKALVERLGHHNKNELTLENSGTLEVLEELGLANAWLARRARREAATNGSTTEARA